MYDVDNLVTYLTSRKTTENRQRDEITINNAILPRKVRAHSARVDAPAPQSSLRCQSRYARLCDEAGT